MRGMAALVRAMTAFAGAIAALGSGNAPIRVGKRESRYSNVRTALTSAAVMPGSLDRIILNTEVFGKIEREAMK